MTGEKAPKAEAEKVYVANVRTALSGPEDGIVKRLPDKYRTASVGELLAYVTDAKQLGEDEIAASRSIKSEMAGGYSVSVNRRPAKPEDKVTDLFETKTHRGVSYESIEVEVASVQEGGLLRLIR